jgi:hypothetical protein
MGIVLEPIRWETDTYPDARAHPQDSINRQIVDDSDLVVGVFWSRLGTPTIDAASGTVEEIERLRSRGKHVMLYFSLANVPQDSNREQFERLQTYKRSLKDKALYRDFETPEELDKLFSQHLARVVHEIAREIKAQPQPIPMRVSNLVSLKPLSTQRLVVRDDSDTWRDATSGTNAFRAAVAIFLNNPIKNVPLPTIDGLKATITFFDTRGSEEQRVYYGTWLSNPLNHTNLSVGDTRELLIAVDRPGAPFPFAIENTRSNAAHYEQEGTREKPLARKLYDVNIRLIGTAKAKGDVLDDFHFNLDLRAESPVLMREWMRN